MLVLILVLAEARVKSYGTGQIAFIKCTAATTHFKGDLSSSITSDPGFCQNQDKYQLLKLEQSLKMSQGRASGALTSLLGINFPKVNLQGDV